MPPRKSILILQGEVVAYRKAVFNALAQYYDVTVLHSGRTSVGPGDLYREQIIPVTAIGPLFVQSLGAVRDAMTRFDATVSMFDLRWPAFVLPAFGRRQRRLIFHGHRYSGNWLADRIRDILMKRADAILLYGDEEVDTMIRRGLDRGKMFIAPNTLAVENHADFSSEPKSALLYVGRLQERKRLDLALRAFARVQGQVADYYRFDIVGAGEPEDALRQLTHELGIEGKVKFHGAITDNERLAPLFRRAAAYVSPGPVGLGALHAFAFGVPVVTLREGRHGPEFHNLIDGENALIVDNPAEFPGALQRICTDAEFARVLGRHAYRRYAESRTLAHLIAGFRAAIEGRASRDRLS